MHVLFKGRRLYFYKTGNCVWGFEKVYVCGFLHFSFGLYRGSKNGIGCVDKTCVSANNVVALENRNL